jgi:hypothetical protein
VEQFEFSVYYDLDEVPKEPLRLGRFVIDPMPSQRADGSGWIPNFTLEEHLPSYVNDTMYFGVQTFPTREEAVKATYVLGRREVARRL